MDIPRVIPSFVRDAKYERHEGWTTVRDRYSYNNGIGN